MNTINTPEIALRRAAILAGNQNPDAMKTSAFAHLDLMSQTQGAGKSLLTQLDLQKENLSLAIQGLELAYKIWSTHAFKTNLARQKFVEETQTLLSTFVLDFQHEPRDFFPEERAIFHFWNAVKTEANSLMPYFGIQIQHPPENAKITQFAVLPYFKMSQALPQKNIMATLLEEHQQAIYLFLKTSLPNQSYIQTYHQSLRLKLKLEPLWTQRNYLNRFRAPLFIVHALANLIWNLQHPVDTSTGLSLSTHENLNLCIKAELFINLLLDNFEQSPLAKIDKDKPRLKTYLLNVERLIKSLHAGYQDQCLNHVNLDDVSVNMHRASRIMAHKLFELLYHVPEAAERFCAKVLYLAEIIMQQPQVLQNLWPQQELPSIPGLNPRPATLMDCLILLAHTEAKQRQKIYQRLQYQPQDVYLELIDVLLSLETQYLQPFEAILSHQHPKTHPRLRQQWFAQYFLAFIALMMECFTVFRDTRTTNPDPRLTSDQHQRKIIMELAASQEETRYYRWSMALFLKKPKGQTHDKIDALLQELNQMRMMTELLDRFASMVIENRILLLNKAFQHTLMDTLKRIRDAYRQLNQRLNSIEDAMNQDEHIQRSEKRILQPMLDDVEMTLESVQNSISQVAEVINHPQFSQKQQAAITAQIQDIQQQFQTIFSASLELPSLPFMRMRAESIEDPRVLNTKKLACIKLIEICYQELSLLSKYHPKGQALLDLKHRIIAETNYHEEELKRDFLKLIELSASPRSSYFFQANYGQTRSAKALIKTLMDPSFAFSEPFIRIIFEQKPKQITEVSLIQGFQQLQAKHQWPRLAPELN